jgi:hypothetical protein
MNRILLGALCGMLFGVIDALITVYGNHPERSVGMLLQAFSSRFAIGFLGANLSLPVHPVLAGAVAGVLISLPDAFGLKAYLGRHRRGLRRPHRSRRKAVGSLTQ